MRGLFRLTPSRSAQVRLSPPRCSQALAQEFLNRLHPGSPKKSRKLHKLAENNPQVLSQKPHKSIENNTQVLPGNPGKPAKSQKITPRFSQEIPENPQNRRKSRISWEDLGGPGWKQLGLVIFQAPGATVSSGKSGWRVAHYFDPQFPNFCRRRCRPFWPSGLPRFKL